MTHELKRPNQFHVQQTKKSAFGIINQHELAQIEQRLELNGDSYGEERERCTETRHTSPAVTLPLVRSPRPEKRAYVPLSPSKTPNYFRWKRPAPPAKTPSKPGPSALSPRLSLQKSDSLRKPSLAAMNSSRHLMTLPGGPTAASDYLDQESMDPPGTPGLSAWRQPSLFEYADLVGLPLKTPTTPRSTATAFQVDLISPPHSAVYSVRESENPEGGSSKPASLFDKSSSTEHRGSIPTANELLATSAVGTSGNESQRGSIDHQVKEILTLSPGDSNKYQQQENMRDLVGIGANERERTPSPVNEVEDDEIRPMTGSPFDSLASSLVKMSSSQNAENRVPQDKVIAQHVLRGKFLRKYLHANSIARKLKETEQMLSLSALHAGASSKMVQKGKPNALVWNKSLAGRVGKLDEADEDAAVVVEKPMPVLRRVSSIDKAINKTVKRIRRLSGMADPADTSTTNKQPSPAPAPHLKAKFASLKAISESQQPRKMSSRQQSKDSDNGSEVQGDADDDEDDDNDFGPDEVKIDPSSAHMLHICQHVMAKRAIKSFLHQEMSVIHQIEASLRDDETMQRHHASTPSSSIGMHSNHSTIVPGESGGRRPIKAMSTDLVDAVTMYLNEGDQHMTIDELFHAALEAEKQKLWKRAILLASACIVIDREFLQAVLLRARCCRRIGLWTQAIKDLGHALLLRPEEHRLFLLRAFLLVKMVDMNNALMDVNRALLLHPKSTEALLLRADIFHRQSNIGASLQDLTTALNLDPSCWRAYYDRATIRIRAIEGDEQSLSYHWEHMKYEQLLVSIIEDYINAVRKGCKMVEVVETVGDLTVRLLEFTGDASVLCQVVHNLSHLLQILSIDHRDSFYVTHHQIGGNDDNAHPTAIERELLIAAIHAQRGRLFVLFNDKTNAAIEFDHAVVSEYHYPVAHFYRGAFAALVSKDDDVKTNLQHLTKSIALDPTIAGAYTVRGALHLRDLKFNNALQDFKAAVATDPTLYEVWLQIALIYLNHYHDCDACIKACTSALTNDSCLARALYLRGEAYTRQGNTTAALKDYGRLTIAQPDDRWAQLMRGRLLLHLKLARPALYSFILFMEQGSADGDKRAHFLCGMAFKILSRFQKAVDEFQRAVSLNPTSENLVLLSESLHSMGDTENSLRVSEKVIFADPGSFKGYVRRAQLLVSVGQFQHAMSEYDKALFLAPKEGRVYYERGIVQMQLYMRWRVAWQLNFDSHTTAHGASGGAQKKKKSKKLSPFYPQLSAIDVEAVLGADPMNDELTVCKMLKTLYAGSISDFSKCMRLEPLLADPYADRAELYALCEEYDKAFRDFECAIERNPKCVRAYVNLGVLKCQFSAFAAAIDDFDKAVKYDPKLPLVFFNRGVAYHKLSLWKQAEASYDQCIALAGGKGRYVDAHRNRAITKCQLGDFEGALRDFDDVRQCAPDDDQLHGGLGYVLLQLGRYVDAAKSFATYGRLSRDTFGDSGNAYFNLANQQQSLDNATHLMHLKTALRFYLRTARIQPCNNDVRLNIANCLRKQREFAKAIMQCDVINSMMPRHHASLESKAFVYFEMHQFDDAIECMSAAIRACVASSSSLGNMFYAFTNDSIRRNALERKTVTSRDGARRESSTPSSSPSLSNRPNPTPALESKDNSAVGATENADRLTRVTLPASEIIVSGSSKQLLSLYMINRGILYEQQGDFEQARQNYRDAIHFDALSVHAQICMGTLHLLEAKFDDSIAHLMKALAIDANSGIAHINMGVAYLCVNKVADALTHFDAAIKLVPNCGYAFANKAVALARTGDLAQAEYNFKRAIEALPSRKEFYLARGKIIAQQKRLQDAMVDFSTALFLGYEGKL